MIEKMEDLPGNAIGLTASGKVTADDYEKVVIPAAGHAANIDQPKAFNEEVLAFLDRLDGRQPAKAAS